MATPVIRPATARDVEAVRACVRAAYRLYLDRMDREPAPMTADYERLIAAGVVQVLEEADAGIVGVLVSFPREDDYFIENVAVLPERHGEGWGRRLLAHADELAREAGRDVLRLYTNVAMRENIAYYPRRGYVEAGRREEDGFQRVYFEKRLPDRRDARPS